MDEVEVKFGYEGEGEGDHRHTGNCVFTARNLLADTFGCNVLFM